MKLKNLHVLLVDDDTDDRLFFKKALEELTQTTHFTSVNDGDQLMQLLTKETTKLPDVLFLDINMPCKKRI